LFRKPDQPNVELGSQGLTPRGEVAWRLVQQQPNPAPRIRPAQQAEEGVEVLLPHVGATQHQPMSSAEVDGPKQDAFGIAPGDRDVCRFALQGPGSAQDGEESQYRLVFTEQHRMGWELL
jgi:hypothetical protein